MNPGGKQDNVKDEEENDPSNMYSKVDKDKKKNNRQTKSYDPGNSYATVSKASVNKEISKSSDNLGARPKQRSPRPPEPVDYSEYEMAHLTAGGHSLTFTTCLGHPTMKTSQAGILTMKHCHTLNLS